MPARHDILVGALDFLWKPWGSIELWEESITATLRRAGVTTMLVSDHPHLFETGGENYHTDFSAWDYVRGHEGDPWRTCPDPSRVRRAGDHQRRGRRLVPARSARRSPTARSAVATTTTAAPGSAPRRTSPARARWRAATSWLRHESPAHDRWMLFVDEFDPHEPFDTPEPWASMYDDDAAVTGGAAPVGSIWPPYIVGGDDDRHDHRGPSPPDPQQLRRQALDDRPLVRQAPRRTRRAGSVGHHRRHRVHRPRPLPRRRALDRRTRRRHRGRHLGQADGSPVRTPRPHPAHDPLALQQGSDPCCKESTR